MGSAEKTEVASGGKLWTGRIMSGIAVLFMIFDGTIHLLRIQPVVDAFTQLGYPVELSILFGILELLCLALYLIPKTSVLGAILLTGYLGGAVAANVRIGTPLFSNALFPVYVGILFWGGLYLRNKLLRELMPMQNSSSQSI